MLTRYDHLLETSTAALVAESGPVDADAVSASVIAAFSAYSAAAVAGQVPEGVPFDVGRENRLARYRLAYGRFTSELLESMPRDVAIHGGSAVYRRVPIVDRLTGEEVDAIVLRPRFIVAAAGPLTHPTPPRQWGSPDDQFQLIESRGVVRAEIARVNGVIAAAEARRGAGGRDLG